MILVKVESTDVNTKEGTKNGKAWAMRFQQVTITGYLVDGFPSKYPRETTIQLEADEQAYPVGTYVIAADAFYFGDFGRFTMGRMKLQNLNLFLAELEKGLQVKIEKLKAA